MMNDKKKAAKLSASPTPLFFGTIIVKEPTRPWLADKKESNNN